MADNVETIKFLDVCRLQQKAVRWLADVCEHFRWCFSLLFYKPQCTSKEDRKFNIYMWLLFFLLPVNWTIYFVNFISSPLKIETVIFSSIILAFLMFSTWMQFINMVRANLNECVAEVFDTSYCLQKPYVEVSLIFAANGRKLLVSEKLYNCWKSIATNSGAAKFVGVIASAYFAKVILSRYDFEFNGAFAKPRTMQEIVKRSLRLP